MRAIPLTDLEKYRASHPRLPSSQFGDDYGYFEVPRETGLLRVISSGNGEPWEHVSISLEDRTPTWEEMCFVKDLFWGPEETVIQFHPKESKYVNNMPHCLHLWKKRGVDYELPPQSLI